MNEDSITYKGRVKYDEERSRRYQKRKPTKHDAEMQLLERAFALIPRDHRVLDVPCGGGRVALYLAQKGYKVSAADLSDAMIQIARENFEKNGISAKVEKQDVESFTFPDRAFDTIVSFRLFHHFPDAAIRARVVRQLCRVAGKNVVLSYFSPLSFTSAKNKLRAALGGKRSTKYATPLAEVERYFAAEGFRLEKDFAQLPLVHTLHVAVFKRATPAQ